MIVCEDISNVYMKFYSYVFIVFVELNMDKKVNFRIVLFFNMGYWDVFNIILINSLIICLL